MHTLCARPVKSTGGSRAEGAPDLAGANRRYSRVRTPAWNTASAKEGYEEKRKEGTALSPAPASARAHAHPLPDRQRAFRITWQIEDLPPAASVRAVASCCLNSTFSARRRSHSETNCATLVSSELNSASTRPLCFKIQAT